MNPVRNIARVAGIVYVLIEVFDLLGISYVPTDPSHTATVWLAIGSVIEGLVGGVKVVGGVWVLLATWGALLAGRFPRKLNFLGVVIGVAGILTIVPGLESLGIGFRLGEVVWAV
jgi:hypothetical protein